MVEEATRRRELLDLGLTKKDWLGLWSMGAALAAVT